MRRWLWIAVAVVAVTVGCSSGDGSGSVVASRRSPRRLTTTTTTTTTTTEPPTTTTGVLPPPTSPSTTVVTASTVPPSTARPVTGVPTAIDLAAFAGLVSRVPELQPSDPTPGCEQLELVSLDMATGSLSAFHSFSGSSPCPGDPMESYVEVRNGALTNLLRCAEMDQAGECGRFRQVADRYSGRQVTVVDIRQCGSGVCAGPVSTRVRR